jgi:hypothetical protein
VQYSYDVEWLLIRSISDQKVADGLKAQRPGSKVRTDVTLIGKTHQSADRLLNFIKNAVRSVLTIFGDEIPNLFEVGKSLGVEDKSAHERR